MRRNRRPRPGELDAFALRLIGLGLAMTCVTAAGAVDAAGQIDGCAFGNRGRNDGQRVPMPGGAVFHVGGAHFVCDDGSEIFADSSVTYEARDMHHLIGNVRYFGGTRQLNANELRYFSAVGRMQATGNVSLRDDEGGSTIRNGDLVLLLTTATREEEEMTVTTGSDGIRPIAIITPPERPAVSPAPIALDSIAADSTAADSALVDPMAADSAAVGSAVDSVADEREGASTDNALVDNDGDTLRPSDTIPPTPYTVVSDRMFLRGGGYFTAAGTVEIVRDSLFAWADSAEYGREDGGLHLVGAARVESATYELLGESITMGAPGAETSEVRARRAARLLGDDLELTAAEIVMVLRDDALERLVAIPLSGETGPSDSVAAERPRAVVEDFVLRADSLEVNTPGERIERVFASGRAHSQSTSGDSLNVEMLPGVARTDWLEGDTIIVTFVPDTLRVTQEGGDDEITVDQIVARIAARTLYRLAPNDTTARLGTDPPAVHYVTGAEIRIVMVDGQVSRMKVIGQTRGIHLEPIARRPPPADSAAVPDTTSVGDSIGARGTVPGDTTLVSTPGSPFPHEPDPTEDAETALATEEVPWIRHSTR